jgi:predicted MPP superfamily phosphohydrolase
MLFVSFILAVCVVDAIRCSKGFITVEYEVASPKISAEVRFVMISDLHGAEYGEGNSELLDAVREAEPDAILVNGDMISAESDEKDVSVALDLIAELNKIADVYLAYGNHEQGYHARNGPEVYDRFRNLGVTIMDPAFSDVTLNGQNIRIGGIADYCYNHYQREQAYRLGYAYRFMKRFCDTGDFKLLLCHIPQNYYPDRSDVKYEDWDCDLVVSGHTHGGLWRIPFLGAPYLPGQGFFPKLVRGLYDLGNAKMIVGAGLGGRDRVFRLNDPCELVVIRLVPEE